MKGQLVLLKLFSVFSSIVFGQKAVVQSPDQKVVVELFNRQNNDMGEWYIKASYNNNGKITEAVPCIDLGLSRSDQDFSKETLPWKSPWRVIIMGTLAGIVGSTLVNDVAEPSVIKNTGWIKPGIASWNSWSGNHGTKDYKIVCEVFVPAPGNIMVIRIPA